MNHLRFTETKINVLNDDCMTQIFQCLSISERIRVGRVCKRWNALLQNTWSDCDELLLSSIDCTDDVLFSILSGEGKENINIKEIISKILKKCGNYIKNVALEIPDSSSTEIMLFEIEKHCTNIEIFTLKCITYEYEYDENIFSSFFSKNKNLKELKLANLNITGFCFSSLHTESIETLKLFKCDNFKKVQAFQVFQNFKSLESFDLILCEKLIEPVLLGFVTGNCQISEFSLGGAKLENRRYLDDYNELLTEFFPKQENLTSLKLIHQYVSKDTLSSINAEKIERLELIAAHIIFENLLFFLEKLKNLQLLSITLYDEFNDKFMQALSHCQKLVDLKIVLTLPILITLESKPYFHNLRNLTEIIINTLEFGCSLNDNLFIGIGECKNLKVVNINNRCKNDEVTDIGMKAVSSLANLKMLIIFNLSSITDEAFLPLKENILFLGCLNCKNVRNEGLVTVIKKCKNLSTLLISGCQNIIIDKFVKDVSKIKDESSTNNVLKMMVSENIDIDECNKNVSPLIDIVKGDYDDFNLDILAK